MSLPALLSDLAALLPERFSYDWTMRRMEVLVPMILGGHGVWRRTYYWDDTDWELDDACAFMWIENALREECEARGWLWAMGRSPADQRGALLNAPHGYGVRVEANGADYYGRHATPAGAFAEALLTALKNEPPALLTALKSDKGEC